MLKDNVKGRVVPPAPCVLLGILIGTFLGVFIGISIAPTSLDEFVWWKSVRTDTAASYARYMKNWPQGRHIAEATAAYDERCWKDAELDNSVSGYEKYIDLNPKGEHLSEARTKIASFQWQEAIVANTVPAYERYLKANPKGPNAVEANSRIESLHWREAAAVATVDAYWTFLESHPDSTHAAAAKKGIESIRWQNVLAKKSISTYQQYIGYYRSGAHVEEAKKAVESLRLQDASALSIERKLEGEDGFLLDERSRQANRAYRSNASRGETLHLGNGDVVTWYFSTNEKRNYPVTMHYSNDSSADTVAVFYDSKKVGECRTSVLTTHNHQWNLFADCPQIGMIALTPGKHSLRLEVLKADSYGLDVDYVSLTEHIIPREMASLRLEAEDANLGNESGAEKSSVSGVTSRNGASDLAAMHLAKGDILSWPFSANSNKSGLYALVLRYSNDGAEDTLAINVDGKQVGKCITDSTIGGGFRNGQFWDEFRSCRSSSVLLTPGEHNLRLSVSASDRHGVEVDYIEIENAKQQAEKGARSN